MKLKIIAVTVVALVVVTVWMGPLFLSGTEESELSTKDHPDWWRPVGGSNAQDSTLERRSIIWNDDDIEDGTVPAIFSQAGTFEGKFYTRGCRGMIEELQLYCIGDGVDTITLRYSPHPCIGPVGEVVITPAAAWAWQNFVIERMWNYDSLFIWVYECEGNVGWAYDAEQLYDGHMSLDAGATWANMAIRPFIRAVYTGETPGDVPVSGIVNNIPIPSTAARRAEDMIGVPANTETIIVTQEGAGYCDYIEAVVHPSVDSHLTFIRVYTDGVLAMEEQFSALNLYGHTTSTPTVSLSLIAADGRCCMLIHKRFEFRYILEVRAFNLSNLVLVSVTAHSNVIA